MTDSNCQRWMSLADREATGETLSESDRKWYREHVASCRHCAGEARFWSALGEVTRRPELLELKIATDAPMVAPAWKRWPRPGRRQLGYYSAAAGFLLLVSIAAWFRHRPAALTPAVGLGAIHFVSVAGDVRLGTRSVRAGDTMVPGEHLRTEQGRACFSIEGGILACLDARGEATVSTIEPSLFSVRLERGRLMSRLERQPAPRRYAVVTSRASVLATGTAFVVGVDERQQVSVHLHEGQVAIQAPSSQNRDIRAPTAVVIGESISDETWSDRITSDDRELLELAQLSRNGEATELDVMTRPAGASVFVDDMLLGPTPTSAAIHAGHRLSVSMPGYATVTELLPTQPGQRLQRNYELAELPSPSALPAELSAKPAESASTNEGASSSKSRVAQPAAAVTPHGLLARAQSWRAEGKLRECAAVYAQLVNSFPGSDEARVAAVSLGELELSELGQPAQALRSFEGYLQQPGPLTREARFGRIRALQMLARKADAQTAIAAFLKDYPNSVQAERLRRRAAAR